MLRRMAPASRRSTTQAIRSREIGLRRVSVATRVLVAASITAAGLFSAMAAWAQPGRSKPRLGSAAGAHRSRSADQNQSGGPQTYPGGNGGDDGYPLSPPAARPDPGYGYNNQGVVSGAS